MDNENFDGSESESVNSCMSSAVDDANSTHAIDQLESSRRSSKRILALAVLYALMIVPIFPIMHWHRIEFILGGYAVALASIVVAGMWAALATGNYLTRTLLTTLLTSLIPIAFLLSMGIANRYTGVFFEMSPLTVKSLGTGFFVCLVGAQIPFLIARFFAGWQLIRNESSYLRSFDIKEIFMIVTVFAIAFSCAQISRQAIIEQSLSDIVIGGDTYVPIYDDSQSITSYESRKITEENIQEVRDMRVKTSGGQTALIAAIYFLVAACLSLPIVWLVFRYNQYRASLALSVIYAVVLLLALMLVVRATSELSTMSTSDVIYGIVGFSLWAFLTWLPLILLRDSGLFLSTHWKNSS